jgi:hypothetical protein
VAVAGCAKPAGVDGDLVNNWPAMPDPKVIVPPAHGCYWFGDTFPGDVSTLPEPMDCEFSHNVETVHVGEFTGADAQRSTPPPVGGSARHAAYDTCRASAKEFFGEDFHFGLIAMTLAVPLTTQWDGGARWYRCDAYAYNGGDKLNRPGSLRGVLAPGGRDRITCRRITASGKILRYGGAVDCATPHELELAGIYDAPDGPYPADEKRRSAMLERGCRPALAAYAGVPDDRNLGFRIGWVNDDADQPWWEIGDRTVRCYIWMSKPITRSLKGAGPRGLPVG